MALHMAENGCYGIKIHHRKLGEELDKGQVLKFLSKFGEVKDLQLPNAHLGFAYFQEYEEARNCLNSMKLEGDYLGWPGWPKQTTADEKPSKAVNFRGKGNFKTDDEEVNSTNQKLKNTDEEQEATPGSDKLNKQTTRNETDGANDTQKTSIKQSPYNGYRKTNNQGYRYKNSSAENKGYKAGYGKLEKSENNKVAFRVSSQRSKSQNYRAFRSKSEYRKRNLDISESESDGKPRITRSQSSDRFGGVKKNKTYLEGRLKRFQKKTYGADNEETTKQSVSNKSSKNTTNADRDSDGTPRRIRKRAERMSRGVVKNKNNTNERFQRFLKKADAADNEETAKQSVSKQSPKKTAADADSTDSEEKPRRRRRHSTGRIRMFSKNKTTRLVKKTGTTEKEITTKQNVSKHAESDNDGKPRRIRKQGFDDIKMALKIKTNLVDRFKSFLKKTDATENKESITRNVSKQPSKTNDSKKIECHLITAMDAWLDGMIESRQPFVRAKFVAIMNLPFTITAGIIYDLCKQFVNVLDVNLKRSDDLYVPPHAFVFIGSKEEALTLKKILHGNTLRKKTLFVLTEDELMESD